jgi:16S rRNA (cytosine967-C5)-methyltransferase
MAADSRPDARAAALRVLAAVLRRYQPFDDVLANDADLARLSSRDRAFARLLCATVLRRLGQIDALIDGTLDRPGKRGFAEVRDLLRLGVAQLVFLGTPAHAAVSTTLLLARGPRLAGFKGLLNAVLRRLARDGADLAAAQDAPRLNTPDWLWRAWEAAYGATTARAIAQAHADEPPLDITVKNAAEMPVWAERLGAELLPTGSLRLRNAGEIQKLPGYAEGAWWVQDAAAALPVRLLGDVAGRRVIELCAAPGGKTAALAAAGAEVTAVELVPERQGRLRDNLARLGLSADIVTADATGWRPPHPAEAVLLDAPCTGTGTIRRHPDIAHLKRPRDVAALIQAQDRLLAAAVEMLGPGGVLVYATCSLQPEEGPARINALIDGGAPVERIAVRADEIGGQAELIDGTGDLRTLPCHWPEHGGLDGFYACRLRRR